MHKLASLLRHSVSFLQFVCGAWPSTGRGVVRASHIHFAKMKISSKESGSISAKLCTSENFPLYSICNIDFDLTVKLFV